jgi:hypothetical protein
MEVAMAVLELQEVVCANDGCSRRFNLGWDGICEDCNLVAQDHEAGLHTQPLVDCYNCW